MSFSLIKVPGNTAAGNTNIYNSDGTLASNRVINGGGNDISFSNFDRISLQSSIFQIFTDEGELTFDGNGINLIGSVGIGSSSILGTALLTLAAGTTSAGTAPLKFTSGPLLTIPERGAIEFLNDTYYATVTTSTARKQIALLDGALTPSTVPFISGTGSFASSPDFTFVVPSGLPTLFVGTSTSGSNGVLQLGGSTGTGTLQANGSLILQALAGSTTIGTQGANSLFFATNGNTQFEINQNGAWFVNSSVGAEGEVLTTHGTGMPPTWELPMQAHGGIASFTPDGITNSFSFSHGLGTVIGFGVTRNNDPDANPFESQLSGSNLVVTFPAGPPPIGDAIQFNWFAIGNI